MAAHARIAAWTLSCAVFATALVGCSLDEQASAELVDYCDAPDPDAPDQDSDALVDACDNCPSLRNTDQADRDGDRLGDVCDDDDDGDLVPDDEDNCRELAHPPQDDSDQDGIGDVCDVCPRAEDGVDSDGDGTSDCFDLCPQNSNSGREDLDRDGVGDACDNCLDAANAGQRDLDRNGRGDACDETSTAFTVEEATISKLHEALVRGERTCEDVIEETLTRIQRFDLVPDRIAPINAFVSFNTSVREQARELDRRFLRTDNLVGALHCVPLVIKDNFDSTDTETNAGTLALLGTQAKEDAFAVAKLRAAGAILIATTSMDELAQGVHGTSSRSGRTGNAYDPKKNSGGSSAGSSAAVASSFAMIGTGTDNCSSLTLPAAYHGLVTLRPTYGLVSLTGVYPSNRLDGVAGPIARTLSDLTAMLDLMAGEDPDDPRTSDAVRPATYARALAREDLKNKRIGVLRVISRDDDTRFPFVGLSTHEQKVFRAAVDTMRALGATVIENVVLSEVTLRRGGGGTGELVDLYLSKVDSPYANMPELCESERYSRYVWEDRDACVAAYEASRERDFGSEPYRDTEQRYAQNRAAVHALMDRLKLDALFYPVDAFGAANDRALSSNCALSSVTGLPALAFQVGFSNDAPRLPIGAQLLGRAYAEETLIALAYAFERATRFRAPPDFTNRAGPEARTALDLQRANARRLALGEAAFREVLSTSDAATDLTADRFREISRNVLTTQGRD